MLDTSGTETTRSSGQKNTGSHSEDVLVPEVFFEATADNGITVGLAYIPTREMGSKSNLTQIPMEILEHIKRKQN